MRKQTITTALLLIVLIQFVHAQPAPENRLILFHTILSDVQSSANIYTALDNGDDITSITNMGLAYYPSWSPDGSAILFVEANDISQRIILLNLEDKTQTEIISTDDERLNEGEISGFSFPIISPDMASIAFVATMSNEQQTQDIFSLDLQSGNLLRVTENNFQEKHLQFSPNGSKLLFISKTDTENQFFEYQIHIIDLTTQDTTIVPNNFPHDPISPKWISDDSVVFISIIENWGIYEINLDDLRTQLLYSGDLLEFVVIQGFDIDIESEHVVLSGCDFSPDSCEIYVLSLQDKTSLSITDDVHLNGFPSWQPVEVNK